MAYSKREWDKVKLLFEKGLSYRQIQKETGIEISTISRKIKSMGWAKNISKSTTKENNIQKGYIYLITTDSNDPYYKIGLAVDVKSRMKSLQSGNHNLLVLKGSYYAKNMYAEEKYWHNKFLDKQHLNEWFKLDADDIDDFMSHCNIDLENHIAYLESLLTKNNINFEAMQWQS